MPSYEQLPPTPGPMPFADSDPAHWEFQYLEDLSTAYWYSQVLFSAVELELFGWIEKGVSAPTALAEVTLCKTEALARLLAVLVRMDLVHRTPDGLVNSQVARRFLVPEQPDYMGDFILYRRYMQTGWSALTPAVARAERASDSSGLSAASDYKQRNFHYVQAMDRLARLKAREIVACLNVRGWQGPILDVGGGAGALARQLLHAKQAQGHTATATLFDLPEVIEAARRLYPQARDWRQIEVVEGDFRHWNVKSCRAFGLVVLSNFLHAYESGTARQLLTHAASLTAADGLMLIHDYFPDRSGKRPHKGALYDINMMLNTYNGACHTVAQVCQWLAGTALKHCRVLDLPSDTSIVLAGAPDRLAEVIPGAYQEHADLGSWVDRALALGFSQAALLATEEIQTAVWAREKCRFGCAGYSQNRMCPPAGIDHDSMVRMLGEYRWAVVVAGTPPGRTFHDQLLTLEKQAFLAGLHKALAFGAGPCPVCKHCPDRGECRHPDLARPSMEGSGIDVFETAARAGIRITPVQAPGRYVKYVGMVLLR